MSKREDPVMPKVKDVAVLEMGDFLHEAVCVKNPMDGDVCWQLKNGSLVDWRRAKLHKGKAVKVDKGEAPKDAK